ncbi:porin family protein [Neolewinella antarctica]|uniref:Outer membrane protein beta-barrel domain-containing protein n=1 Tax=Neolewinella antarctica TaxID=442734 RepID=A0ABX0X7U8_9BACT|nr:porin family protein [Neolewinella antarctica]NJC25093.1 hypothetical protein [Neolewinella antarctica]
MRNLSILLAFLLCGTASLAAQSFGLRVGLNATNAKIDLDNREIDTDGQTNLMLGIFANLPVGTSFLSVQPELTYLNRGYSYDADLVSIGGQVTEIDRTLSYVDLGVLARLNFGGDDGLGFYAAAGPQFSYAVSGQVTTSFGGAEVERDVDFDSDRLNRSELQFAAVGGVTFTAGLKFFAELRYNGSFSNQSDFDTEDIRQRSVGINGGIMIPLF